MRILLGLVLLGAVLVASCASSSGDSKPESSFEQVAATRWRMVSVDRGEPGRSVEPLELAFDLPAARVTGYSGVNRFTGGFERSGESLRFGPFATTRRAGPPELMELETQVLTALGGVRAWRATPQGLLLLGEDERELLRCEPLVR